MAVYQDQAIVISAIEWKESSLIARVFTRERGRLSLTAKGARRTRSRIGASLESFSRIQIAYYLRPGKDIGTLKEAAPLPGRGRAGWDVFRFALASFFFEILDKGLQPLESHADIFDLTCQFLDELNAGEKAAGASLYFLRLAERMGFAPGLDRCEKCGKGDELTFFDPAAGRAICEKCAAGPGERLALPEGLRRAMMEKKPPEAGELPALFKIIHRLIEYHFDVRLRSASFLMEQLGRR